MHHSLLSTALLLALALPTAALAGEPCLLDDGLGGTTTGGATAAGGGATACGS
ncbi:MAG: adhesin, partial [Lysobacter sp.]|nr:adhesin [Lysobacter sp.]